MRVLCKEICFKNFIYFITYVITFNNFVKHVASYAKYSFYVNNFNTWISELTTHKIARTIQNIINKWHYIISKKFAFNLHKKIFVFIKLKTASIIHLHIAMFFTRDKFWGLIIGVKILGYQHNTFFRYIVYLFYSWKKFYILNKERVTGRYCALIKH